ncbi:MAG: hypothetical protein JWN89_402 [Parcubacteria group bacterium]|nr:hypothetical protein [Parcubacteria group bacterium]
MEQEPTASDLFEKERLEALEHIRNLGPHKSVGYLPVDSMERYFHISVQEEIDHAKENGLIPVLLTNRDTTLIGTQGALFVYEPETLSHLLTQNRETLEFYGWPVGPEEFVRRVGKEYVYADKKPLLDVIRKAFGDFKESNS